METITIQTLQDTTKELIFGALKEAFTNYVIPLDMNPELHFRRWETAGVNFSQSYGAFQEDQLVAFILQVPLKDTLYNFGTGVIPKMRGQRLVGKIYDEIFESEDCKRYLLEVIQENDKAVKLYQNLGFHIVRELYSFDGFFQLPEQISSEFDYHSTLLNYTDELKKLRVMNPATESSEEILMRKSQLHELHEARQDGKLLAYVIFTPHNSSIREMGLKNEDALDFLLQRMNLDNKKIRLMNVESTANNLITYLEARNLKKFVSQYEMEKLSVSQGR